MPGLLQRFLREEQAQDLIEYGLLIGIISVAALAAIRSIGPTVASYFSSLDSALT